MWQCLTATTPTTTTENLRASIDTNHHNLHSRSGVKCLPRAAARTVHWKSVKCTSGSRFCKRLYFRVNDHQQELCETQRKWQYSVRRGAKQAIPLYVCSPWETHCGESWNVVAKTGRGSATIGRFLYVKVLLSQYRFKFNSWRTSSRVNVTWRTSHRLEFAKGMCDTLNFRI